ncbi:MAG: hypothetical protein RLZZ396_2024 [Planctomycetota bacterium]|jgi:hypothetical protein
MNLCQNSMTLHNRRSVLQNTACGFGWLALSALMAKQGFGGTNGKSPGAHFSAKAKRVIFLYMKGGPSHVDTFDYKPELAKADGQTGPRPGSKWMKSPWKFQQRGQSGLWISDLFPELSKAADDMLIVNSMQTDVPAHAQATIRMHTGTSQFVRPSVGSWVLYGLGAESESIPGFISIGATGSAQNYGNAFLPAYYQGMRLGNGNREVDETQIANLAPLVGSQRQRRELDFIQGMNQKKLQNDPADQEIEGVIRSYEMAHRMQSELPKVLDIKAESEETKRLYGLDRKESKGFGSKCLVARRMIEAGVRFVEITQGSWDHHASLQQNLTTNTSAIDQPMYGLITDLKQRGLLEETLIVWSGEFGRTPYAQGRDGRDHNHKAFSLWMAGGGVASGKQYGTSGEFGVEATENPVPIVDFHATLLALLGLDHQQLTYPYAGRDFRLTETKGRVIKDLIG